MHHCSLEFGQQLHLLEGFLGLLVCDFTGLSSKVTHGAIIFVGVLEVLEHVVVGIALAELLRRFDALDDPLGVLIFLLLNVFLDMLWVVALQTVGLNLEAVVEVCKILHKVVHSLGSLLFFGQRHLEDLANHAVDIFDGVVRVRHLLLDDQTRGFKGSVERHVSWVLHLLVVVRVERQGLLVLLLDQLLDNCILICFVVDLTQNFILLI